jgi:GT2 family glycosyltransferase
VTHIYELALHRTPKQDEVEAWATPILGGHLTLAAMVNSIATSPEAQLVRSRGNLTPEIPNGRFVQFAFEELLGRGPLVEEIGHWDFRIAHGMVTRGGFVSALFAQRAEHVLIRDGEPVQNDPTNAWVMGTDRFINVREWQDRAASVNESEAPAPAPAYPALAIRDEPQILVSAIASLYRGGDYIEQFLDNITGQTLFSRSELIIVDADSPENEYEVIKRYMERFPNIVYHRAKTRIPIYEAWNLGVKLARGRYCTNTNLDDLRRHDSFERQAEILEKFSFVHVTYQDFYYSFDGSASFEKTAAVGTRSQLPVVTPCNLVRSNSPHNAPMWRRNLHDELGLFDESFRSAGDHDFWMRCIEAGKTFYKVNDPHVVYFVNPDGLSTRPNTRGVEEGLRTTREHGHRIMSPRLLSSDTMFLDELHDLICAKGALDAFASAEPEWRYAAAQQALRLASITSRAATRPAGG